MKKTNNLYLITGIFSLLLMVFTLFIPFLGKLNVNDLLYINLYYILGLIISSFALIVMKQLINKEYQIHNLRISVYLIIIFSAIYTILYIFYYNVEFIPMFFTTLFQSILMSIVGLAYILMAIILTINFKKLNISLKILVPFLYIKGLFTSLSIVMITILSTIDFNFISWLSFVQLTNLVSLIFRVVLSGLFGFIFLQHASPKRMDL